jgi:VWFA-related protein
LLDLLVGGALYHPAILRTFLGTTLALLCFTSAHAQRGSGNPLAGTTPGAVPLINVGAGAMESQFETLQFAEMILHEQNQKNNKDQARRQALISSGTVSAFDLAAPAKAVNEFNKGAGLMSGQHSEEAIEHFQKAIEAYPKFVSAHNYLGLAYLDNDDPAQAVTEFKTATELDAKFASPFMNLGRLLLSQNDFVSANQYLEQASALRPKDATVLTILAYAQHGNHQYQDALDTVDKVHALQHPGMGNAHYVAAVAAVALNNLDRAQAELSLFLEEDPTNSLAPTARQNLEIIAKSKQIAAAAKANPATPDTSNSPHEDLANAAHLQAELAGAGEETADDRCTGCRTLAEANPEPASVPGVDRGSGLPNQFTIRKVVDEVAVFFGVSSGGHSVTDLALADITVHDDNKPPSKILQFSPQSKLPLRIGLLIDTSGSVNPRFSFEKRAASKFLEQMLSNPSDLGFVAGFANELKVTQDFTPDHTQLQKGVQQLTNNGGTALFDAVSRSCWKLAAYPEHERVARVLVVVSDGQENSSRITLRQTIRDIEATGVTVYTISTKEAGVDKTEADKVLEMLAERSGGEALFPGDVQTLGHSFDKLRDEIRSRYLIAYKPADFEPDGKYRTIAIIAEKNGKRYHVHARKGYHARAETAAQ